METIKRNAVLLFLLAGLAVFLPAVITWASLTGLGVENAKPPDQRQRATSRQGSGYIIWYGSGGRGGGYGGGGGFRGGK